MLIAIGLICLSMFEMRALRSLVDSLRIPSSGVRVCEIPGGPIVLNHAYDTKDIILELLFDIFRIKSPSWSSSFLAGRRLTSLFFLHLSESTRRLLIVLQHMAGLPI